MKCNVVPAAMEEGAEEGAARAAAGEVEALLSVS